MKKEERLLRALGNVRDCYVSEAGRYVDGPEGLQIVNPKQKRSFKIPGMIAAMCALLLTGGLSINLLLKGNRQTDFISLSNQLRITNMIAPKVSFITANTKTNPRSVQKILVFQSEEVVQTIDAGSLPAYIQGENEGMFLSAVDINDLPSDISGCNQGLFFEDGDGTVIRTDVDFRDVNFDGYADLGLAAVNGYPENLPYNYLCWDPETEKFEYAFTLYGGAALEVDEKKQMLIETVVENGETTQRYYQFSNGTLQIASEQLEIPEGWPSFRIDYDSRELELVQGVDGLILCPIDYSEELPVCEIKIEFLPNLLPYAAMERSRMELADYGTAIHQDQETLRYSFHIAEGSLWDSHMADVYIVGAGSAGSYRLTSKYFMEAAEGWGITFAEICGSFTCTLEESPNPEAEKAIMDFAEGYFSGNQITMLSNYYGDSSSLRDTYTGDASRVQIVSLQGLEELDNWLDNWIEKDAFTHVSLAFLETEQSDSYTYLSMEVMKTQAGYRVSSYGLEK